MSVNAHKIHQTCNTYVLTFKHNNYSIEILPIAKSRWQTVVKSLTTSKDLNAFIFWQTGTIAFHPACFGGISCLYTKNIILSYSMKQVLFLSIQLIIRALPYRDDFITALKVDPTVSDEVLYQDIRETASVAKNNIDAIYQFYVDSGQNVDVRSNGIQFDE